MNEDFRIVFFKELGSLIEAHDHSLDLLDEFQQGTDPHQLAQEYFDTNISPYWYPDEDDREEE